MPTETQQSPELPAVKTNKEKSSAAGASVDEALSEQKLKDVLRERQIEAWRSGGGKLQYIFAYLVAEVVFSREKPNEWNLTTRSMEVDQINRILRREEDVVHQLLESKSLLWNKLELPPQFENAAEIQPEPYRYGDLIFLCISVPHWVQGKNRKAFIVRARNVLLQFRNNNPAALIIAVTQEKAFRLPKDSMFEQWADIAENLAGIRNKNALARLVARQITSNTNVFAYINGRHTVHKLQALERKKELQRHVDGMQALQTGFNLLIVIHPGLHETHSKRIWQQLRSLQFRSIEVRPQNELRPEHLKQFDFFILMQCGFPESFRDAKELQRVSKRIYSFKEALPAKLPLPRKREFGVQNALETRYLRLIKEFRAQEQDESFLFLKEQYQTQWKLLQDKNINTQQIKQLDEKLSTWTESYFTLVEAVLLEATQHIHDGSRFGGVMKNLTRYLIVDDYNPEVIEYLVKRKFPRHNLRTMTSIDLFQRFNRYKQDHPNFKGSQAYQQFMRNEPVFKKFEVVFVNAWNIETDGTLSVKLRLAPPLDDPTQIPDPADVKLTTRNLHTLLATDKNQLFKRLGGKEDKKKKSAQQKELQELLKQLISKEDLTTASRIMGVKKGKLYSLFQIEENMEKLAETLKTSLPKAEPELDATPQSYAFSARNKIAGTSKEQKITDSENESSEEGADGSGKEDENWFMPVVHHQIMGIQIIAGACAVRWQDYADNTKSCRYLEIESQRSGEAPEDTLQRALVCALSRERSLPEKGVLAAFPDLGGSSRLVYSRVLPGRSEMIEPEYALYLIDMRYFRPEEVIDFLRDRNSSAIAHIPVLLFVPEEVVLDAKDEAVLGRLIGVPAKVSGGSDGENNGFPEPFQIDDLENVERVKYFVRGILRVDDAMLEMKTPPPDFLESVPYDETPEHFSDDGFPDF